MGDDLVIRLHEKRIYMVSVFTGMYLFTVIYN